LDKQNVIKKITFLFVMLVVGINPIGTSLLC